LKTLRRVARPRVPHRALDAQKQATLLTSTFILVGDKRTGFS